MDILLHKNRPFRPPSRSRTSRSESWSGKSGVSEDTTPAGVHARPPKTARHRPPVVHNHDAETNGIVKRFKGRISEGLATHHFDSRASLEQTLDWYVHLDNHHLPHKALDHQPPIQALKCWHAEWPVLFHRKPRNHPGPDIYGGALRKKVGSEKLPEGRAQEIRISG
mgnify:CR=1 FL=1